MSKARQQEAQMGEGLVFAYIKDSYWNTLQAMCEDHFRKTSDPFYVFWRAYAQYQNGNATAAINSLLSIQQKKQISYACYVALMHYQSQARNIDREQLNSLRAKQRDERRSGADKAFVQAIFFLCLIKQFKKAYDLLDQKYNDSPLFVQAKIWYKLWNIEEEDKAKLQQTIEQAYNDKDKVVPKIHIFMARYTIKCIAKKFDIALQTMNEGIVYYPTFIPFMTEKYICLMSLGDWDQFKQIALQVSQRQTTNINAVKALAFYELAREGSVDNAFMKIKQLQTLIERKENKSPKLLYEAAHLFLRVCGRSKKIVQVLMKILQKCRKSEPLNADYAIQMGNQYLMIGQVEQAYKLFQQASSLDQSKLDSITGMIQCKLLQDDIDDAQNQIQFVNVMQQTVGRTPVIAYLQALLTIKKPNQTLTSLNQFYKILDGALKMQIAYSKTLNSGFSYYSKLNPNFLFSIAQLYLRPVSTKQMMEGTENPNPAGPIGKGIKLLESITRQIPGFVPAYLLLAKGKLAIGNEFDSSMAVGKVLDMDSKNQQASIIQAMIRNKKKDYQSALNSLQQAIAINFKIRENPLFMLIKGEIEYEMKNFQAAEETMVQAIGLPSVKKKVQDDSNRKFRVLNFSQKDRCSIYLLLAKCYVKNNKQKQSKQVMTQAISQFAGTNQEVHVLLTNAYIAIQSNDVKKAMSILKAVKPDSTYFVQSRKMLADIHLKYLKSRKGYARCYYEIIQTNPSFQNYKIYGDALIKINEPEEASTAYEKAYQQKPDNQSIIRDLGRSYALAHNYEKATKFYEDNIEKLNRPDLILDLAKLCVQLRKYERAQQLLSNPLFMEETGSYQALKQNSDAHLQLFRMYLKAQNKFDSNSNQKARKQIKLAVKFQKLVYDKIKNEGGPADEEKLIYSDLYYEVGKYAYNYEKNIQTTQLMLKECLKLNQQHQKALQILAEIYLNQGNLQSSQRTSQVILKINPKNEQAGSILAEILLKSNQYEKAIERFKSILDQNPDKYAVLSKLIDFFRRSNQLTEAKVYIEAAQNKANNTNDAGLCYCRGLYHKYSRNLSEALIQFNKAKKSSQYAENSIFHMIDIFLCPEQEPYYSAIEGKTNSVHPENIRICESLLREMSSRASWHRYVVMEALVAMCSGKSNINLQELAKKLVDVLVVRAQYPPAMLAIAIIKYLQKKDVQGNNFLKLCAKLPYMPEYGEELEKAWLLHAETYVQIKKFDNAQETIRMILKQNKSSGKAYQLLGLIKQKQQAYVDAAESYQKAFEMTQRKSPGIGYRLAYNYMKAKRHVDCLQTCRQVLEANPKYEPIKIDIQSKVMEVIR